MRSSSSLLRPLLTLAAIATLALTTPSFAAEKTVSPDAPKKQEKSTALTALHIAVDRGTPVNLPTPASSVFIANPEIADIQVLSPTSIMVFGKRTGQTTLMATDGAGKTLLHRTVLVEQDLSDLRLALKAVIPNNRIKVEAVPNGIVLTGEADDPSVVEDARRLASRYVPREGGDIINRIKVSGSNQVHIRVRFAEVSRDVDKRLGINWDSMGDLAGITFGLATGAPVIGAATIMDRARTVTSSETNDVINFSRTGSNYNVNGAIDALAQDGFVTILAEPNLTAMSGETASFLAGGEFPVPVPQSQTTITIEWKEYGVSLAFTPTIVGEDRLNLHVRPEVSQLSDAGAVTLNDIVVPALTTRRAETTLEMASGQSFVLGGLLNNNQSQSINKYPFLGDIPVLGNLFRSTRFQNNETELVIIITPYIVKPSSARKLSLPTDGFSAPSDNERVFERRLTNKDPDAQTMSGEAIAVPLENEAPIPQAAPMTPVEPTPEPRPAARSEAVPPVPMLPRAEKPAPVTEYAPPVEKPAPVASPVTSYEPPSVPEPVAVPTPVAMPLPKPSATHTTLSEGPVGPGGFILE